MKEKIISYPSSIDLKEFKSDKPKLAKYGLPEQVKFCKTCVMTNQRPNSAVEFNHTKKTKNRLQVGTEVSVEFVLACP